MRVQGLKKKPTPNVVKIVASATALAALGSSLVSNVDPLTCLLRGVIGYFVGKVFGEVWCALFPGTRKTVDLEESETLVTSGQDDQEQLAA